MGGRFLVTGKKTFLWERHRTPFFIEVNFFIARYRYRGRHPLGCMMYHKGLNLIQEGFKKG